MGSTDDEEEMTAAAAGSGDGGRGGGTGAALESLSRMVAQVSALPECRGPLRQPYCDLARRVKLLSPLFEELGEAAYGAGDGGGCLWEDDAGALVALRDAIVSARDLLRSVSEGSKLYQVSEEANS